MTRRGKRKIGRNDPCPCGSGNKYKRCHGRATASPLGPTNEQIAEKLSVQEARERLRQHEQGKGKPIVSGEIAGRRVVAVGNRLYHSKNFKTFIDFLNGYIKTLIGPEWGNKEIAKPLKDRHQILKWYDAICAFQRAHHSRSDGGVEQSPMTGLIRAYYGLAYNLYLLQHNAELQAYLITRLKNKDGFHSVYYETYVAAWFILAGFELSIENEQDSTRTHVEFIATKNGRSYSVEAKTRAPGKKHFDVGNQLYKALCKEAKFPRVVFIDLNMTPDVDIDQLVDGTMNSVKSRESKLTVEGAPAPPAYVIVTNQPFHLSLNEEHIPHACLGIGFRIPDFGHGVPFVSLIEAHKANQKHSDIGEVLEAFRNYRIPASFDGELAEFAYGDSERRFTIGQRYEMSEGVLATLTTGTVVESKKLAYLSFYTDDNRNHIWTAELTDAELSAYQKHPETFFGKVLHQGGQIDEPMEMFEFILNSYQNTSREKILDWMKEATDIEELKKLPDEDLRYVFVERQTLALMSRSD